ncbi:hypothetical protein L596_004631 [Steinernema carpocapsae]|uniref:Elongation of very long chain fatty acids protein n=1 Tax=Steinernema carpocapsae TaxID=34508 RepID=A0A4U8UXW9_STECR|nr:hypothetical protein L596_004631 [Steinernema carpocapsae]
MTTPVATTPYVSAADILFTEWDLNKTITFMSHWVPTSFKVTIGYLAMVYFGQKIMKKREAFQLDNVLAIWNFLFSIFSGFAAYRLIPELFSTFQKHGFVGSYCYNEEYYTDPYTGYWGWMFVMSKAPELGDTLFLVLRKKPVIFMHWYHHALTFLYATITYNETQAWSRWSLALNLTVHTVMYFYFGVRALGITTPKPVAKFITTIQIVQFVISCYIFGHLVIIKSTNSIPDCKCSWNVLALGAVMYLSYLYLFAQFFYNAYIAKRHPGKSNSSKKTE